MEFHRAKSPLQSKSQFDKSAICTSAPVLTPPTTDLLHAANVVVSATMTATVTNVLPAAEFNIDRDDEPIEVEPMTEPQDDHDTCASVVPNEVCVRKIEGNEKLTFCGMGRGCFGQVFGHHFAREQSAACRG